MYYNNIKMIIQRHDINKKKDTITVIVHDISDTFLIKLNNYRLIDQNNEYYPMKNINDSAKE